MIKSKFIGSMLGSAVGDALGAFVEGFYSVRIGEWEKIVEEAEVLRYTDDTHMMIGVAESLIEKRKFDGAHMAETFVKNYYEPWRGYEPAP